jgi:SAM-dependent methyltransferase
MDAGLHAIAIAAIACAGWVAFRHAGREGMDAQLARPRSLFDAAHGVDTDGEIPLDRFDIAPELAASAERYMPVDAAAVVDAVTFLGIDPRQFTFVDLGCGKGRALMVAAQLGFARVIGVELVPELADTARRNLARLKYDTDGVETGDAGRFRFPAGKLVLFLYNPFNHDVVRRVIENLRAVRGELFVIYKNAQCAEMMDACGFLHRLGVPPGWEGAYGVRIWGGVA